MQDKIPTISEFLKNYNSNEKHLIRSAYDPLLHKIIFDYSVNILEAHKEAIKEAAEIYIHPDACSPGDAEIDKESIDTASKNFIDNLKQ